MNSTPKIAIPLLKDFGTLIFSNCFSICFIGTLKINAINNPKTIGDSIPKKVFTPAYKCLIFNTKNKLAAATAININCCLKFFSITCLHFSVISLEFLSLKLHSLNKHLDMFVQNLRYTKGLQYLACFLQNLIMTQLWQKSFLASFV